MGILINIGLVFGAIITLGACENNTLLRCYDCDPGSESVSQEQCRDPANNPSIPVSACSGTISNVNGSDTYICATVVVANGTGGFGVVRGCAVKRADVANYCEWYAEEKKAVTACVACADADRCNEHLVRADGTVVGGATATGSRPPALLYAALLVLLLNALACLGAI